MFLMSALAPVVLTFPKERAVFLKEENSKLYTISSYFTGRSIVELPILVFLPIIWFLIIYWMSKLNDTHAYNFFIALFIGFLVCLVGNSFGLLIGSFFSEARSAMSIVPLVVFPLMLFGGFYKNSGDLPVWSGWI